MEIFNLKAGVEYIELNNLLKIFGWVGTGGEAKNVIKQGDVLVNGEIETRVRKKMRVGDALRFGAEQGKIE